MIQFALLHLREHFDLRLSIRHIWRGRSAPPTVVRTLLGGAQGRASLRQESDGSRPAADLVQLDPDQIREAIDIACD
jgi:hypothetical protein